MCLWDRWQVTILKHIIEAPGEMFPLVTDHLNYLPRLARDHAILELPVGVDLLSLRGGKGDRHMGEPCWTARHPGMYKRCRELLANLYCLKAI